MDSLGLESATMVGNDRGGAVSQIVAANHPERVERLVLTNCDTFEHFPPFPFNLMPKLARLPGGIPSLAAPFRFAAVREDQLRTLAQKPMSQELVADWLEPALSDPAIRRDVRKVLSGIHKRHTLEAAEKLRVVRASGPVRVGHRGPLLQASDAERLAALVPDGRIEDIPGGRRSYPSTSLPGSPSWWRSSSPRSEPART